MVPAVDTQTYLGQSQNGCGGVGQRLASGISAVRLVRILIDEKSQAKDLWAKVKWVEHAAQFATI